MLDDGMHVFDMRVNFPGSLIIYNPLGLQSPSTTETNFDRHAYVLSRQSTLKIIFNNEPFRQYMFDFVIKD
jgi:hypothetical protein